MFLSFVNFAICIFKVLVREAGSGVGKFKLIQVVESRAGWGGGGRVKTGV